jgi:heme-degrading monooxygenase HmoA
MSIIMTLRAKGDPSKMEQAAASDPDRMQSILGQAKDHGLIAHRFYGSDDGQILVVDEWPDAQSFQAFFEQEQSRIQPLMQDAGISSEPEISFWRKLETGDDFGWGA